MKNEQLNGQISHLATTVTGKGAAGEVRAPVQVGRRARVYVYTRILLSVLMLAPPQAFQMQG